MQASVLCVGVHICRMCQGIFWFNFLISLFVFPCIVSTILLSGFKKAQDDSLYFPSRHKHTHPSPLPFSYNRVPTLSLASYLQRVICFCSPEFNYGFEGPISCISHHLHNVHMAVFFYEGFSGGLCEKHRRVRSLFHVSATFRCAVWIPNFRKEYSSSRCSAEFWLSRCPTEMITHLPNGTHLDRNSAVWVCTAVNTLKLW